ncbi:glycoside hydrolase family 88 protein [Geminicoccus roseus]|uniref:glycoside hydrolase family 88 protein n=1 Tax=Geminicoccus roseus TaxID=404900 RepID=UPI00041E134B|nr:glycoside hydrolase family 88 protein [Geminicoccus roseus]
MSSSTDLGALAEALDLLGRKLDEDEPRLGISFPYVTRPDGSWDTMLASRSAGYDGEDWSHGNWFCGFWVGLLAAAHVHTGEDRYLDLAKQRMLLVAQRADDPNTHDIGFIFWSSAVPLHRLTSDPIYADLALRAADRLRARVVVTETGSYVSSWGPLSDPRGRAASAIDTMANIPLLYWAAEQSGDASFRLAAEAHARMTEKGFVRENDTLFHAVEYDTVTGARQRGYTFQGYADGSSWSRGTGWAVYGYAATAAVSGQRHYLDLAVRLAERWLEQLGDRTCPPWDFDDPSSQPVEDSAAAAIMVAALLDLGDLHSDEDQRQRWRSTAMRLLSGLARDYLARDPVHRGLLMHGCYSKPHNIGPDAAVLFGDYYFVEALMRVLHPGKLVRQLEPLGGGGTRR